MTRVDSPLSPQEISDRLIPVDPQLSPDGRHAACVVARAGREDEHPSSSLWVSADGAPAHQFTGGLAHDHAPRWSPDGNRLLFLSDRKTRGEYQLHLIPVDGGEAMPIGKLSGDLSDPKWSPDGSRIAVLVADPETEAEKKRKAEKDDAYVVDADPKLNRLWIIDIASGTERQITFGNRQIWSYGWDRTGASLAICTTDGPDIDAYCGPGDCWIVPASGGIPRHVSSFPALPTQPHFLALPAGETIAVRCTLHRADPVERIYLVSPQGGEPVALLPEHVGNIEAIASHPGDPTKLVARVLEGVHDTACIIDPVAATISPLLADERATDGTVLSLPSISRDGSRVAVIWADGHLPDELYVGDAGTALAPVTSFGAPFAGRLSPAEVVRWESDGWEVEGLLTYPVNYVPGERYPLILEVHGGPTSAWEDSCFLDWHDWAQMMASRGFAVLQPNPRGSTGRGVAFQRALQDDVGGGEVRDLINGAQAMVARGIADPDRLGIGGWSWGGYLTATTITKTSIFKAAMMGAGLSNLISDHGTDDIPSANLLYFPDHPYRHHDMYWEGSAIKNVATCVTPTLIVHGDADLRVHWTQGAEMYRALKVLGVPVEFVRYPREPHSFKERKHQIDLMQRIAAWFERWL